MNICFLAPANSIHSLRWIKYFSARKHHITWISLHAIETERIDGVDYYAFNRSNNIFKILLLAIKIRNIIKSNKPDVLHVHSAAMYGLMGALSGFHPMVLTPWGSDILGNMNSPVRKLIIIYMLRKADLITADAQHMIGAMVKLKGNKSKMNLIYFGIDTSKFFPLSRDYDLRKKLTIDDSPAVFSLRNFLPVYDIESLVKSVSYVLQEIPQAKFIIAGSGPQKKMLKGLAGSLGVIKSINFIGNIENARLPEYFSCMDIYVSTSLSDAGISASTAEAMACGVPVIITDSGENKKWITDGENGFIVAVRSPEELAKKIIRLIKDKILREKFSKFGRQVIEERNDYFKEMKKMEDLYKKIIDFNGRD